MEYGICDLSVVPLKAEPSDKSEMVSQLLFGETFTITLKKSSWLKIKVDYDGYEAWLDEKQYMPITADYYKKLTNTLAPLSLDIMQSAVSPDRHIPILIGSSLPEYDGINFKLKREKLVYSGQAINTAELDKPLRFLQKVSNKYLNAPYLWGGRSPFGIDCSGFTQQVFKLLGVKLPRDAYQQAEYGSLVDFVDLSKEGDLAFFENKEGKITHVGIVLEGKRIIHASGRVRIDKLDHYGIHNKQLKKYTHKLKSIKRLM